MGQIRLAISNGMDDELFELAQHTTQQDILNVATYFQQKEQWAKAAKLYAKVFSPGDLFSTL